MRIVANWLSETMAEAHIGYNLSDVTKIISPLYLSQCTGNPSLPIKDKFLICRELSENMLKFISVNEKELSVLHEKVIEENNYPDINFNTTRLDNISTNWQKNNLASILNQVKSVESKFNYFHQTERLKDCYIAIENEYDPSNNGAQSELSVTKGKHSLHHILNKVKEIHRPDVFDITSKHISKRKKIDIKVSIQESLHFQILRNQFQIDTVLAKHLSIASISDILIVESEEEYSQFAHFFGALATGTKIILAKEFKKQYKKIVDAIPNTKIAFIKQLLLLMKSKNWVELHENRFRLDIQDTFLGFFSHAILIKNKKEVNQLILSNPNGSFSQTEKKNIERYIQSFLSGDSTLKNTWQLKNLHITFDPSNGGQLIINFL